MFFSFQAAETQGLLQYLHEELKEQKQKNADLVKLHEEKEPGLETNVREMSLLGFF